MPSGKKSRQLRAAAPVAPPRRRQASPRVLAAAAAVIAVAVLGIVLSVVFTGGSTSTNVSALPTNGSVTEGLPGAADVNAMFKGIPQHGLVLGSPKAKVTLTQYIDLQCPYCRQFETTVMPDIVSRYVKTGKVKVEARTLAFIGPDSVRGRKAMIADAARSIPGLDPRALFAARSSGAVAAKAAAIDAEGKANGVNQTPTLYVGGKPVASDAASLTRALDAALAS